MTPELERLVEEFDIALRLHGYTIESIIAIDENGEKIGAPIPPKKKP